MMHWLFVNLILHAAYQEHMRNRASLVQGIVMDAWWATDDDDQRKPHGVSQTDGETRHEDDPDVDPRLATARLEAPGTVNGLVDWCLDATPLAAEVSDTLEKYSEGLRSLQEVLQLAAQRLPDDRWDRFLHLPTVRVHQQDPEAIVDFLSEQE